MKKIKLTQSYNIYTDVHEVELSLVQESKEAFLTVTTMGDESPIVLLSFDVKRLEELRDTANELIKLMRAK